MYACMPFFASLNLVTQSTAISNRQSYACVMRFSSTERGGFFRTGFVRKQQRERERENKSCVTLLSSKPPLVFLSVWRLYNTSMI